ncbi:MAG: lysophospholipase [Myxococcota bacterium]|nr:lysophospholipase [Myxococcota bacterium]
MNDFRIQKNVWEGPDGTAFQLAQWPTPEQPNGFLFVIHHGHGEHADRYTEMAERLVALGFEVVGYDVRGHGQSAGARGDADGLDGLIDDLESLLQLFLTRCEAQKIILFGHSMGGATVARYLTHRVPHGNIAGVILSSPALGVHTDTATNIKLKVGRVLAHILPKLTLRTGLDADGISSDPREVERYLADPLIHSSISTRLGTSLVDQAKDSIRQANNVVLPTLVYHGTNDSICDIDGSRRFAENATNCDMSFESISGGSHELHHEVPHIQAQWWNVLESWLTSRHMIRIAS